jgi:nucleoside-diphosphate-sugar epimerase
MKILFTGSSSFTGHWFIRKLADAGHEVHACFTRDSAEAYGDDVRGQRVKRVIEKCRPRFSCRFGDDEFHRLLRAESFELLCHHAADVTNYKSADFDIAGAVANNTHRMRDVLTALKAKSDAAILLTGTFFESGEGTGSEGLPAFSPYGLSKALTAQICKFHCRALGVRMGKFVIPNPFGPWEDARFTTYLMRTWSSGDEASVRSPNYMRDNIHVSLLAPAYVAFAEKLHACDGNGFIRTNPSGYVENQGSFAERVAREMRQRTGWECRLSIGVQTEYDEPRVRMNTEPLDGQDFGWDEAAAWDEFAQWYGAV